MAADITAIILTKNEEVNIEECIKSIITTVKRIVVIDSFSTDKTVEIAKRMGAEVYQHPFENYAKQYMYGVEVAKAETVWTLRIDADERLTPDSANELTQLCDSNMKTDVTGIVLRFKKNFLGKDLYHGGVYPWKKMNCYKTKFGEIEDRNMDEHIILSSGKVIEMKNDCLHFDFKTLSTLLINIIGIHLVKQWIILKIWKMQKPKVKWMQSLGFKMNVYYKLPIGFRSHLYYLYRYYIKLGFLDGKEGKIYAFLQAYWYRYLVDAKIYECKKMNISYNAKGSLKS